VVVWRQGAELAGQYLSKGSKVCIQGKLQTRDYEDKDGVKRYVTEVVADPFGGMIFLTPKKSTSDGYHYQGGGEPPGGYAQAPPGTSQQQGRGQQGRRPPSMQPEFPYGGGPDDPDSDIPF
jgi:single-strand DNA-binding protein